MTPAWEVRLSDPRRDRRRRWLLLLLLLAVPAAFLIGMYWPQQQFQQRQGDDQALLTRLAEQAGDLAGIRLATPRKGLRIEESLLMRFLEKLPPA